VGGDGHWRLRLTRIIPQPSMPFTPIAEYHRRIDGAAGDRHAQLG
jgi:hypothetical protein